MSNKPNQKMRRKLWRETLARLQREDIKDQQYRRRKARKENNSC